MKASPFTALQMALLFFASSYTDASQFPAKSVNHWEWTQRRLNDFLAEKDLQKALASRRYPQPDEDFWVGNKRTIVYFDVSFTKGQFRKVARDLNERSETRITGWALRGKKLTMELEGGAMHSCTVLEVIDWREELDFRVFDGSAKGPEWIQSCSEWSSDNYSNK